MSSLLKAKNQSAVNRGKIIGGAVVGTAVIAFFFLPEILGIHSGEVSDEPVAEEKPLVVAKASPSPVIDELLNTTPEVVSEEAEVHEIKTIEDVDRQLASMKAEDTAAQKTQEQTEQQAPTAGECVPVKGKEEEKEKTLLPAEGPITWKSVKKPAVQQILAQARGKTQQLIAELPKKHEQAHFELTSFVGSINKLTAKEVTTHLSPEQALQFLDYRDAAVSAAFAKDGVSRVLVKKWQNISLTPILQESFSQRKKEKLQKPYRPRVMLSEVVLRYDWTHISQNYPFQPLRAKVIGYVLDSDTKKLEFHFGNDTRKIRTAHLSRPDERGRRFFKIPFLADIRQNTLSITAISADGKKFRKMYDFYSRARQLPVSHKKGVFTLRLPFKPLDPRVDRVFLKTQGIIQENGKLVRASYSGGNRMVATF